MNQSSGQQDHVFYSNVDPAEAHQTFRLRGLDGLRAIAVSLVVIYHLWPALLPGGMMGVDIFFVISGYLITALLLREGAFTGKMNIIHFWVRRLRRLIPAIVVLVASVGAIAFLVDGDIRVGLGRQVLGAFTFSSNWLYIASGNDYFAQTSPELLTNFWSLAVEEQFYIFWPIILVLMFMFLTTWTKRLTVPLLLVVVSVVLALIFMGLKASPSRIYYGTDTHLFGIMLGVALALLIPWSMYPPADHRLYPLVGYGEGFLGLMRGLLGWISLFAIFPLAILWGDQGSYFMPWGLLLASILGVGVIQALLADLYGPSANIFRGLLSLAPLVWIGKRSYSIYLWHWPLAVIAHYVFGPDQRAWTSWVVLLMTLLIAGLSYMYVEEPIRRHGFGGAFKEFGHALLGPRKAFPLLGLLVFLLAGAGTAVAITHAPQMTQAEAVIAAGQAAAQQNSQTSSTDSQEPAAQQNGPRPVSVSVVGDSVTLASIDALREKLPEAAIDAQVSRTLVAELPALEESARSQELGQIVVISLSTNSTMSATQIDEMVQALAPREERKIIMVTGAAPSNLTWVEGSNQLIQEAATKHSDTILIADWAQTAKGHPDYLLGDGVHPQGQGQEAYAQTIADAVESARNQLMAEGKLSEEDLQKATTSSTEPTAAPSPATAPAW